MPGEHQTFRPSRPIPTFAIFTKLGLKLSYHCKKIAKSLSAGGFASDSQWLLMAGGSIPIPKSTVPPLQMSGFAPG